MASVGESRARAALNRRLLPLPPQPFRVAADALHVVGVASEQDLDVAASPHALPVLALTLGSRAGSATICDLGHHPSTADTSNGSPW